jgi:hypothetical protein
LTPGFNEPIERTDLFGRLKSLFSRGSVRPPAPRRLDGRSTALLAASIKMLPFEEPGWITMKEARILFSPKDDEYAFEEMDEVAKRNLATFRAEATPGCLFEFMPVEDRVYFMRRSARACSSITKTGACSA